MLKICCLVRSGHAENLSRGLSARPNVKSKLFSTAVLGKPEFRDEITRALAEASVIFAYGCPEAFWDGYADVLGEIRSRGVPVVSTGHDPGAFSRSDVAPENARKALGYLLAGGPDNAALLVDFLAALAGRENPETIRDLPGPVGKPSRGLWHPEADRDFFPDVESYLSWYRGRVESENLSEGTAGILFGRRFWANTGLEAERELTRALEDKGLSVIPAFCDPLKGADPNAPGPAEWARACFLDDRGKPRVDVLVKLLSFFGTGEKPDDRSPVARRDEAVDNAPDRAPDRAPDNAPDNAPWESDTPAAASAKLFEELGVPVFQPIFSSSGTVREWENDPRGVTAGIAWTVAMPEFEGAIEPFYLGGKKSVDGPDSFGLAGREPSAERIKRFAARVRRRIKLGRKKPSERKVSFILHDNPCLSAEATLGSASKLDAPESVARILKAMKENGYDVEVPESGKELIGTMLEKKAVNEFRWTSAEDIVRSGGALALLPAETYREWFDGFPESVREKLVESWGLPPGEEKDGVPAAMVFDGKLA
ncbi:MAG: cobaltochelatase subunit CobN, partial [Deltaproteobacteria bacterium]|nr:cobaltochelatase subunit CobN [Deltaproteobacteria bacterium]